MKDSKSFELVEFAKQCIIENFVWGDKDCIWLARRCVEIMTGEDKLAPYIPEYNTQEEAIIVLSQIESFEKQLELAGAKQVPLSHITVGDLIFVRREAEPSSVQNMCVYVGSKGLLMANDDNTGFQIVNGAIRLLGDEFVAYRVS